MIEPVVIGQVVGQQPAVEAFCTFPCVRCGCLLSVRFIDARGIYDDQTRHECCGVAYRLVVEARVKVGGVGEGVCPIHGEPAAA